MDCQTELPESFRHDFHDALGVLLVAEPDYEIVRISNEEGVATHSRLHVLYEPKVEHIVQEYVRKDG